MFSRRIVKRRKSGHTRTPEAALVEAFRVEQQRTLIAKGVWVDYGPPDARALWATFKRYRKQDITPAEMEAAVLRFWGDKRWWEGSTDPWKRFVKNLPALVDLVRDPNIAEPLAPAHEDDWRNLVDRYLGPVE